ncbi:Nn.00g018990.m01.CDS01 [Neocucurbitaria sp. VM-36]
MSRSQPRSHPRQNGPSRDGHVRDRGTSRTSSQEVNGTHETHGTSRTAQSSRQRSSDNHVYTYEDDSDSDSDHNTLYGNQQDYARRQHEQYAEVTRSWATHNPEISRIIDNPALNIPPSSPRQPRYHQRSNTSQTRGSMPRQSPSSLPPPPPPPSPPPTYQTYGQTNNGHLTSSSLEDHNRRNREASIMRRMLREPQRAGPYDNIGYVRRDGRVYEYEYEYGVDEAQSDARSDTLY